MSLPARRRRVIGYANRIKPIRGLRGICRVFKNAEAFLKIIDYKNGRIIIRPYAVIFKL
ncbi:MAG: hypothetical protein FWE74_07015 [Oscillospiraceae bacterium]|nr:hypothetical protein [Oscillospiraceae bacterium]